MLIQGELFMPLTRSISFWPMQSRAILHLSASSLISTSLEFACLGATRTRSSGFSYLRINCLVPKTTLLGIISTGGGVKQDTDIAIALYKQAAEDGFTAAMVNLGGCIYSHGESDPSSYAQALVWYRKAAAQGNHRAEAAIGEC